MCLSALICLPALCPCRLRPIGCRANAGPLKKSGWLYFPDSAVGMSGGLQGRQTFPPRKLHAVTKPNSSIRIAVFDHTRTACIVRSAARDLLRLLEVHILECARRLGLRWRAPLSTIRSTTVSRRLATMTNQADSPASAPTIPFLRGRAFYESIGSPKFVVAPMVDQSEFVCAQQTTQTRRVESSLSRRSQC